MKRQLLVTAAVLASLAMLSTPDARAGCGCTKPAPPPASVRPHATYPGSAVTIFGPVIEAGTSYRINFRSDIAHVSDDVYATAIMARDLTDGVVKPQLVVAVPALPPGPTKIRVGTKKILMTIPDTDFTVVPSPVAVPNAIGPGGAPAMQAGVSRSGVVYVSLDLTGVEQARVFEVQLEGYPLTFTNEDVLFYNRQGFLMQALGDDMPGLFAISQPDSPADSDLLRYSRHEFNTYFLQHEEREEHAVDPSDPNWHLDGTPHIDHNHLIVAIIGTLRDGGAPQPGATPSFALAMNTYTLFHHGLVGDVAVQLAGTATTDSYDSGTGLGGSRGDVRSNGVVLALDQSVVDGDATAGEVEAESGATITGQITQNAEALEFLPVDVPSNLTELGFLTVNAGTVHTLTRGSYRVTDLIVEAGATLIVDNTDGPVTVYVDGMVVIGGAVDTVDANPENFAVYVAGTDPVVLNNDAVFHGVVYAPTALVDVSGLGQFHGAFVGESVSATADAAVHFDTALRGAHVEEAADLADDPIYEWVPIDPIGDPMPSEYLM